MNSSKKILKTKPKYKAFHTKRRKNGKLRRRVNYFTNSLPYYYFYSNDKKNHP